jgi:hypothetical protein
LKPRGLFRLRLPQARVETIGQGMVSRAWVTRLPFALPAKGQVEGGVQQYPPRPRPADGAYKAKQRKPPGRYRARDATGPENKWLK